MVSIVQKLANRVRGANRIGGEGPRGFVGGLWHEMGELQFKYLVSQGLEPRHVLLDIACGSLRAGVRFIPYLDAGNYLGIDIDPTLIEHGKTVELGPDLMRIKQPQFVVSAGFEFETFDRAPDFAMAQSLFTHLVPADIELCLRKFAQVAKPTSRLFGTYFVSDEPKENPPESHPHKRWDYTQDQMRAMGETAGLAMTYVGDWNHPRDQKMAIYQLA